MAEYYQQPRAAHRKLEEARASGQPVYIFGVSGAGKTALIRNFFGSRQYSYRSCRDTSWKKISIAEKENQKRLPVFVIDDLQFLTDQKRQAEVIRLLRNPNAWSILICRGKPPLWLKAPLFERAFCMIGEEDLHLSGEEAAKLAASFGISLSGDEGKTLTGVFQGNGYAINAAIAEMVNGATFASAVANIEKAYEEHVLNILVPQYKPEIRAFIARITVADAFTLSFAETVTDLPDVSDVIREMEETTNVLIRTAEGWRIREPAQRIFPRYAAEHLEKEELRSCFLRAGIWYENQARVPDALRMYEQAGAEGRIFGLLTANARENPASGYFYEMRRYYLALPEEKVRTNPVLMAALSMTCSLMMDTQKSDVWYDALTAFRDRSSGVQKREAESALAYLDITLPHRDITGMLDFLEKWLKLVGTGRGLLPEFSVTSNLPTVMNGGKDFCDWSKRDSAMARKYGKMISLALGRYGKGLVHEALGESYYEKGHSATEVLEHLTKVSFETRQGGHIELAFAAVGIQCRLYISNGEMVSAKALLQSFRANPGRTA